MWEDVFEEPKDKLNLAKVWNFIRILIKWKGEGIKSERKEEDVRINLGWKFGDCWGK